MWALTMFYIQNMQLKSYENGINLGFWETDHPPLP